MQVQVLSRALVMASLFEKAEKWVERRERRISSLALILGFIFDSLTLKRVDLLFENLTVLSYLVVSGSSIILLNYYKEHPPEKNFLIKIQRFLPFFIQFAFGGLFSAFFIFYTRSAALASSWPFVLILLFLFIGNEFFKERYERLTFLVSIYFVAIFSFSIFFAPVVLKIMGADIFVLSGLVSLLVIYLFTKLLFKFAPSISLDSKTNLTRSILSIFVVINILYFTNLIPPIPLSLKEAGVYHSIERVGDNYQVVGEKNKWYESLLSPEKVHITEGSSLYVFSSVFAPTDLDTRITHDWQYFDETLGEWTSVTKVDFYILGGRGEGYRGFSVKENVSGGKWRVDVKTDRGQIIGRIRFDVETGSSQVVFENKVL